MSARRTKTVEGYVNFPVDEIQSSQEGGMSVLLVVSDVADAVCCTPQAHVMLGESYIRDDIRIPSAGFSSESITEAGDKGMKLLDMEQEANDKYREFHFPKLNAKRNVNATCRDHLYEKYMSVPYAAVIRMGSTGWSGYTDDGGYWFCTYNDLTDEGKALYNSIKKLYPESKMYLQTWLDT